MFGELLFSNDAVVIRKTLQVLLELADNHSPEVMDTFGNALLDKRGVYLRARVCNDLVAAIDDDVIMAWLERQGDRAAEVLARHLPQPFVNENGQFIVPELLDRVLEQFPTDAVFASFHAGLNSGNTFRGDLSPILKERAEQYKTLRRHKNPAIRRFARKEAAFLSDWAEKEKLHEEEDAIVS